SLRCDVRHIARVWVRGSTLETSLCLVPAAGLERKVHMQSIHEDYRYRVRDDAVRRIGIIGAGRVGTVLGARLQASGHHIVAVSARSDASRARAAALLPDVAIKEP